MRRWTLGSALLTITLISAGIFPLLKVVSFQQGGLPSNVESHYAAMLKTAEERAKQNQPLEAMQTIAGVPSNSEHFEEARQLQDNLSRDLLRMANEKYNQADLATAINLLRAVPSNSSVGEQAKQQMEQLSQEARQLETVRVAQAQGNWGEALSALEGLRGKPIYNSTPIQNLVQQLIARAYDPGSSAVNLTGDVALVPQLTAPNPTVTQPQGVEAPKLAALAVDVDSALSSTRFRENPVLMTPSPTASAVRPGVPSNRVNVREQMAQRVAVQPARPINTMAVLPSSTPAPDSSVPSAPVNVQQEISQNMQSVEVPPTAVVSQTPTPVARPETLTATAPVQENLTGTPEVQPESLTATVPLQTELVPRSEADLNAPVDTVAMAPEVSVPSQEVISSQVESVAQASTPSAIEASPVQSTPTFSTQNIVPAPVMSSVPETLQPPKLSQFNADVQIPEITSDSIALTPSAEIFGSGSAQNPQQNARRARGAMVAGSQTPQLQTVSREGSQNYQWQAPVMEQNTATFQMADPTGSNYVLVRP